MSIASILPNSFKSLTIVRLPNSMTIWLSVFEVSYPNSIFKESFSRSLFFIVFESALILEPASFMKPHKGFVDLSLSLRYLLESVLCSKAIKHSIFELPFVSNNISRIEKLSITIHFVIFPFTLIGLSIGKDINSLSFLKWFFPELIPYDTVSKIFWSKLSSWWHIRVPKISNDIMSGLKVLHLIFNKGIKGIIVVVIFSLCTNFRIDHSIEIIFMSGLFRFLLKQWFISSKVTILCDFIGYVLLYERDLNMFSQLILFLKYVQQGS